MRQTQKYVKACERLTFPHRHQEQLYSELNRIGYWWNSKKKEWERDDRIPKEASTVFKIRVMGASDKVDLLADHIIEQSAEMGLELVERSAPYPCRPPQQNDSRIYLSFREVD